PGYGYGSRGEWGKELTKVLTKRSQVRRALVLLDAERGPNERDLQVIDMLAEAGTAWQVVLTKADRV
ncbi:hypothetical protein BT63DRAFT_358278, partial [Microthyrium microscopicum]